MNKIILIGNLTRDPESGSTQGGVNFTRFTIAVNRPFTNSAGERVADYFDIICWRQLAERCAKYLFKGSKVGINGYVQRRQYEDRDGIKRTSFDVVADEVEFLTPRNTTGGTGRDQMQGGYTPEEPHPISDMQPVDNDDLPF
ncbi:MAG: single-stranded DNA-binding protein [Clostridiales bacterium]|nr:single-stranded DNA-binding protein [Clostridiales bacterium]